MSELLQTLVFGGPVEIGQMNLSSRFFKSKTPIFRVGKLVREVSTIKMKLSEVDEFLKNENEWANNGNRIVVFFTALTPNDVINDNVIYNLQKDLLNEETNALIRFTRIDFGDEK